MVFVDHHAVWLEHWLTCVLVRLVAKRIHVHCPILVYNNIITQLRVTIMAVIV